MLDLFRSWENGKSQTVRLEGICMNFLCFTNPFYGSSTRVDICTLQIAGVYISTLPRYTFTGTEPTFVSTFPALSFVVALP
jgi:hypothetical protein